MMDTDELAFPTTAANYDDNPSNVGMTLRDYFAAKVLQGFCAASEFNWNDKRLAKRCYEIADAMVEARYEP